MNRAASVLVSVALLLGGLPLGATTTSGDHPVGWITHAGGDAAMPLGPAAPLLRPGAGAGTAALVVELLGAYRYETQEEWDNIPAWGFGGHPLSETGGWVFTADYGVGMAVGIHGAQDGEVIEWQYVDPDGTVRDVETVTYDYETDCWTDYPWYWCGDPQAPFLGSGQWIDITLVGEELPLGTWTMNFYDNQVFQFAEQFELTPSPTLEIVDARMVTPTELGIGAVVTFPDYEQEPAHKVRLAAEINGSSIDKSIDIMEYTGGEPGTYYLGLDGQAQVIPTTPLKISLADPDGDPQTGDAVDRLGKNEQFVLSGEALAELAEAYPIKSRESLYDVRILLPMVVLHGYDFPSGYPPPWYKGGTWGGWQYAYWAMYERLIGAGYEKRVEWDYHPEYERYRTLWNPEYGAMYSDPRLSDAGTIELDVAALLDDVWAHSYASEVVFVGHSFGGLVARTYAAQHPESVNTVITVGTPHKGTTGFYAKVFSSYLSLGELEDNVPAYAAVRWAIPKYPCLLEPKEVYYDPLTISGLFSNTLVAPLQQGVAYHAIYATDRLTLNEMTLVPKGNWYQQKGFTVKVGGDGLITADSAGAGGDFGTPWPVPGKKNTDHPVLLNNSLVQAFILGILAAAP